MRIAIFSDCYLDLTGGIIQVINAQKAELEKMGHTVYVFSTGYPKSTEQRQKLAQKRIFQVPSCRWLLRGLTPVSRRPRVIERWLARKHPELKDFDIFYIHYEAGCSIAGIRLARKLGKPVVQMMHGREDMGVATIMPRGLRTIAAGVLSGLHALFIPHSVQVRQDDYLARTRAGVWMWELMVNHADLADVIITPSLHFKRKLQHYGVSKPIYVVPNGYPDEKFLPEVMVKELAAGETLRMIWHSRVQGEKRIIPFLEALKILQDAITDKNTGASANYSKKPPKFTLDAYGDGTELGRARRYAARHHLPVKFHGDTPFATVQKAILKAHLDVMASYNCDTFGMTLIEAEACGVPVFFCDPDMREVVPAGSYVLSTPETPEAMAAALADLMNHPERIAQMSAVMINHRKEVLASQRIKKLMELLQRYAKNQ